MAEHQPTAREAVKGKNGRGPSTQQILALVTLLPVGGILLFLCGVTLIFILIGLALATPVFVIFSPVIVPAVLVIGLAVGGFLAFGAFGITALSSLLRMASYIRRMRGTSPLQVDVEQAKQRFQESTGQLGQKTREMAQTVHSKAQELIRGLEGGKK